MEDTQITPEINTLLENMLNELTHAAFLLNLYDIIEGKFINIGPADAKQAVMCAPHAVRAAKLAEKLEQTCSEHKEIYGTNDDIELILNGLQDVYDLRDTVVEWFAQYKPKTQPL